MSISEVAPVAPVRKPDPVEGPSEHPNPTPTVAAPSSGRNTAEQHPPTGNSGPVDARTAVEQDKEQQLEVAAEHRATAVEPPTAHVVGHSTPTVAEAVERISAEITRLMDRGIIDESGAVQDIDTGSDGAEVDSNVEELLRAQRAIELWSHES